MIHYPKYNGDMFYLDNLNILFLTKHHDDDEKSGHIKFKP